MGAKFFYHDRSEVKAGDMFAAGGSVVVRVKRCSRKAEWCDITVANPDGHTWTKRMPKGIPSTWLRLTSTTDGETPGKVLYDTVATTAPWAHLTEDEQARWEKTAASLRKQAEKVTQ